MMFASLWKAPAVMLQHAGLFLAVVGVGLVSALVAAIGEIPLVEWSGGGFLLNPTQPINLGNFLLGGIVFLVLIMLVFFLYAFVARQLEKKATPTISFMMGQAFILGLVATLIGSALIAGARGLFSLVSDGGIVSIVCMTLALFLALILLFTLIKLSFTPILLGYGLTVKEALAESWNQTAGHFWSVLILLFVLNIIGTLIQSIDLFLPVIENEMITLAIAIVLGSVALFYSITVFSLALPNRNATHSFSPRKHGRTK